MILLKYKIIITLIITTTLFFNLSANALFNAAHAVEESGHSSTHKLSIFDITSGDHCPACPDEDHQNTDHSHYSCEHHSSLYFGCLPLTISHHQNIAAHSMNEPFKAFPEVYLEKFIPPRTPA